MVNIGSGSTFTAGILTHNVAGNWVNDGTFIDANSTINLNGAAQTIIGTSPTNFNNLTLSGSGNKTFSVLTNIAAALAITGTGTVQVIAGLGPVADFSNVSAPSARLLVGSGGQANILAGSTTFGSVDITGGLLSGAGTLNVSTSLNQTGGSLSGSGATLLAPAATTTLGAVAVNRALTNQGSLALNGSTLSALLTNSGGVSVSGSANANAGIQQNAGFVNVPSGQTLGVGGTGLVLAGGTLKGGGTIVGNVNNQTGVVSPGASPGILTITGNYTQSPTGTLNVEIAGTTPGTQYDQLIVSGTATLDGNLSVSLLSGFIPSAGNTFNVLQAGSVSGTFASTSLPLSVSALYGPAALDLQGTGIIASTAGAPLDTASIILDLNNFYFVTADPAAESQPLVRRPGTEICR